MKKGGSKSKGISREMGWRQKGRVVEGEREEGVGG